MRLFSVFILLGAVGLSLAERILFLLPAPSRSHYILNEQLMERLAAKGHDVTVIAPFRKSKSPEKITEIIIPNRSDLMFSAFVGRNSSEGKFQMRNGNAVTLILSGALGSLMMETVMSHQPIKDLLNSDENFDLVVGESFLMEGLIGGLAHRYKAPLAMISPSMPFTYVNELAGNPAPPAYIPELVLGYSATMNFKERLLNMLFMTFLKFVFYNFHLPQQDALMKQYFGEDCPPVIEILHNNPLVLINHHFSLAFPRPYVPNMVEIGGYHVRPPKPLPQDLQKFISEAKDGVILFSMGSNLRSEEFPKEKFDGILRTFSRLKERVLWKFENENPAGLPKNVKISKWLPQSDVLAHPNVKLFITHGGLLSLTESVFRGVPVIVIPIFGDQPTNAKLIEEIGVGIKLEYDDINEESLYNSIQELLNNPKYKENVIERSKVLKDRPMSPVETAVYWLEYVMRHKGAKHLKSGVHDLAWYQQNMLDVWAVLLLVLYIVVQILNKLLCLLMRMPWKGKKKKQSSKKKNN